MIAYIDSSVVLRVVLGQPGRLAEWKEIVSGIASGLVETECLRTIDRLRLTAGLSDEETARRREAVYRLMEALGSCGAHHRCSASRSAALAHAAGHA